MRRQIYPYLVTALALSAGICPVRAQKPFAPPAVPSPVDAITGPAITAAPRVVLLGNPLTVDKPENAPYRDPADGAICIPPAALAPLGILYIVDDAAGKVTLTTTDGALATTVDARTPASPSGDASRVVFIPAVEAIEALGGKCEWEAATGTLYARAVLTGVEMEGGKVRLKATLPILPTITRDDGGRKIMIDVPGADVGTLSKTLKLDGPGIAQARCGQFESDTVRVVLEMRQPSSFAILADKPASQIVLSPIVDKVKIAASMPATAKATATAKSKPVAAPAPPTVVSAVTFRRISSDRVQFVVNAGRIPVFRAALQQGRLTLDMLNATLGPKVSASLLGAEHPFLKAAQIVANGTAAQLVVELTRVVCFSVKPDAKGALLLDLSLPRGAGGKLAGKLIVVDAGHGGGDSGARGMDGSREKDVNLAIAMRLADSLREAGASVLMTRADDFFIPVNERPRIANRVGADFFISIHADSGDSNHSINGSTVYYHASDDNCYALARSISDRLRSMGAIPPRNGGTRTDYVRFPNYGYGVLRNSRMVAVLCECGYMSNADDLRRLNKPEMQQKIAEGIRAGLRDYIEGNPDLDTRDNNPAADNGDSVFPTLMLSVPTPVPMPTAPPESVDPPESAVPPASDSDER